MALRTKLKVKSVRQCKGCARELTPDNELMSSAGDMLGWCGFCKPSTHKVAEEKHKDHTSKVLDYGRNLTVRVGATASRSFRKSVEEIDAPLRKAAEKHAAKLSEWPSFTRETFARLYDENNCKPLPENEVSSWGVQASGVLERQPEWPTMREASQAHRSIAADVSARLSELVASSIGLDNMPENGDGAADPRDLEGLKKSLRELLNDQGLTDEQIKKHPAMTAAENQEHIGDKVRQQLQTNLVSAARRGTLRSGMTQIAEDAQNKAEAVAALAGMGVGSDNGADGNEGVPEDLIKMAAQDGMLLKIIKQIGRMQEAYAESGKSKIAQGNCDVVGIRPGDDIGHLLPFERAKLVHSPATRREVIMRILEKQATCWELKGEENRNEGDVVLLVDRSGSMGGDRIIWARALAAVIMSLAVRDGRRVGLVMFDHTATGELIDKKSKLADGIRMLGLPASGGTDIDAALNVAEKILPDLREPDVIVISDGHFYMHDEYVAKVKENDGRLFAIMLGGASIDDDRFDKIWAPTTDTEGAIGILSEVRR